MTSVLSKWGLQAQTAHTITVLAERLRRPNYELHPVFGDCAVSTPWEEMQVKSPGFVGKCGVLRGLQARTFTGIPVRKLDEGWTLGVNEFSVGGEPSNRTYPAPLPISFNCAQVPENRTNSNRQNSKRVTEEFLLFPAAAPSIASERP